METINECQPKKTTGGLRISICFLCFTAQSLHMYFVSNLTSPVLSRWSNNYSRKAHVMDFKHVLLVLQAPCVDFQFSLLTRNTSHYCQLLLKSHPLLTQYPCQLVLFLPLRWLCDNITHECFFAANNLISDLTLSLQTPTCLKLECATGIIIKR